MILSEVKCQENKTGVRLIRADTKSAHKICLWSNLNPVVVR